MRFIIRAKIPTEAGNKMVQDPNFLKNVQEYIDKVKAEADISLKRTENRLATFIVDMRNADQIAVFAEPRFTGMGANVEFHPVMNLDDLKKGISQANLRE